VNILADLSPEMHINGIVRAAYAFFVNVWVPFRHMDKDMFKNIYETYMRPTVEYAAPFWNPHLKKHEDDERKGCSFRVIHQGDVIWTTRLGSPKGGFRQHPLLHVWETRSQIDLRKASARCSK
ncbi:hypothetical protein SK128_003439, partial [Halocaridina rubra]